MGFITPLALIALAAGLIPVLAHLMRRRDLPLEELPTWTLLRKAEAQSRRRVQLVDLLLLLLRVALFSTAAVALAAPYVQQKIAFGNGTPMAVAIVLDDSMSMSRALRGETLLGRAVERAHEVAKALAPTSELTVVLAGSPPRALLRSVTSQAAMAAALDAIPDTSARGTDIGTAVSVAGSELSSSRLASKHLLVLSDVTEHGGWSRVDWPEGLAVDVEPFHGEGKNRFVESVEAVLDPTRPGHLAVSAEFSGAEGTETIELLSGDKRLATSDVDLTASGGRTRFDAPVEQAGTTSLTVRFAKHDSLAMDDARSTVASGAARVRCLVVTGDADRGSKQSSARFLLGAIAARPEAEGAVDVHMVDPDALSARDVGSASVIVVSNVSELTLSMASLLETFVTRGGGLLIAAGDKFDGASYRAALDSILPARPSVVTREAVPTGFEVNAPGPLPTDGLSGVEVRQRVLIDDWPGDSTVLLSFSDGTPALLERPHGTGRVLFLATALDDTWSNLPYRIGYVPLISRLIARLAGQGSPTAAEVRPGFPHHVGLPPDTVRAVIVGPDGDERDLPRDGDFRATDQPGVYRVLVESRSRRLTELAALSFAVVTDTAESNLAETQAALPKSDGAKRANAGTIRQPLSPWLFLAVGVLGVIEALLRRQRRRA